MSKYSIRTATKAIIIKDNKLLVIKHKRDSDFYTLPGGGQNHNEDLKTALKRECIEELGADIDVKDIIFVCEYIADNHEFTIHSPGFHQVDIMFECVLIDEIDLQSATEKDEYQVGIDWIEIDKIKSYTLYPMELRDFISDFNKNVKHSIYVGEIS